MRYENQATFQPQQGESFSSPPTLEAAADDSEIDTSERAVHNLRKYLPDRGALDWRKDAWKCATC